MNVVIFKKTRKITRHSRQDSNGKQEERIKYKL